MNYAKEFGFYSNGNPWEDICLRKITLAAEQKRIVEEQAGGRPKGRLLEKPRRGSVVT